MTHTRVNKNKPPTTVAVIPYYNCGPRIRPLIQQIAIYADVIVLVDDGSQPSADTYTLSPIMAGKSMHVLRHNENKGYGQTIADGMRHALALGADCIILVDGDGQHDPTYIPRLIKPILLQQCDMVIGSRYLGIKAANLPLTRNIGIQLITTLTNVCAGSTLTDAQSGFRAFSARAADVCIPREKGMEASLEVLYRARQARLRICEVPAQVTYTRNERHSQPTLLHGLRLLAFVVRQLLRSFPSLRLTHASSTRSQPG